MEKRLFANKSNGGKSTKAASVSPGYLYTAVGKRRAGWRILHKRMETKPNHEQSATQALFFFVHMYVYTDYSHDQNQGSYPVLVEIVRTHPT